MLSTSKSVLRCSRSAFAWLVVAIAPYVPACDCEGGGTTPEGDAGTEPCADSGSGTVACNGQVAVTCGGSGTYTTRQNCAAIDLVCAPVLGCVTCVPGSVSCDGNAARVCRADGSGYDAPEACDTAQGETCNPARGGCTSPCLEAVRDNSYIGCEYWPTPVLNSNVPEEFDFAVVVANPSGESAAVTVSRADVVVAGPVTIAAHGIETIRLAWVPELKGEFGAEESVLLEGGAYRLEASRPVTVYQFNALDYAIDEDCVVEAVRGYPPDDDRCYSYSNDASLLLPTHALTGDYLVISRPAQFTRRATSAGAFVDLTSPGFFTVVGVENEDVNVEIQFSAYVQAATNGSVAAHAPGETATFVLGRGDVLQIVTQVTTAPEPDSPVETFCWSTGVCSAANSCCTETFSNVGSDYDLTGSTVRASGRVAVLAGHNCAFVPHTVEACDHLEEMLFPFEAWGRDYVVSASQPLRAEPNVFRVVSGRDGNEITFTPADVMGAVTLDQGEFRDFETDRHFRVVGTESLMVAQFLVGQDYEGIGSAGFAADGDPSMSFAIPSEQYRADYTFLAPDTYEQSYVNVTATAGQEILLDGEEVAAGEWVSVPSTDLVVARLPIAGGVHTLESTTPFGIVVYGFGDYTSYMMPGGLDFEAISGPF